MNKRAEEKLGKDYPELLAKMSSLPPVAEWIADHGENKFQTKLDRIVGAHRRRILDDKRRAKLSQGAVPIVDYNQLIAESSDVAFKAEENLKRLNDLFFSVEDRHFRDIFEVAGISPNVFRNLTDKNLRKELRDIQDVLEALAIAIPYATGVMPGPRRKGRPGVKHVFPASELAMLWNEITRGGSLSTPRSPNKGPKNNLASQFPIEFIKFGLKMIDPDISEARVSTAIKTLIYVCQKNDGEDDGDNKMEMTMKNGAKKKRMNLKNLDFANIDLTVLLNSLGPEATWSKPKKKRPSNPETAV